MGTASRTWGALGSLEAGLVAKVWKLESENVMGTQYQEARSHQQQGQSQGNIPEKVGDGKW